MAEVHLDEATHQYWLNDKRVPGVTEVLKSCGLIDYSKIPQENLLYAQERGQFVHEATAMDDEGNLDIAALDPVLAPYVAAWRRFKKDSGFTPIEIETIVFSPAYGVAGKIDRKGIWSNHPAILDLKPPSKQAWWRLQTAGYGVIEYPDGDCIRACISLFPDESYRVDEHRDFWYDRRQFLACLTVHNLKVEFGCA